jgi:hypothetical protein
MRRHENFDPFGAYTERLGIGLFSCLSAIRSTKLNVEVLDFEGVFLNKVSAFFHVAAHQYAKEPVGFTRIIDPDA